MKYSSNSLGNTDFDILTNNRTLKGFGWNKHEKFPRDWEIVTDQWEDYKKEMEGLEDELREDSKYSVTRWGLGGFDIGNLYGSGEPSGEPSDKE